MGNQNHVSAKNVAIELNPDCESDKRETVAIYVVAKFHNNYIRILN